jgi:hypothetical protein
LEAVPVQLHQESLRHNPKAEKRSVDCVSKQKLQKDYENLGELVLPFYLEVAVW